MKKIFVILIAAAFCFGATSCVRDCKCVGTYKKEKDGKVIDEDIINQTVQLTMSDCAKYEYKPVDPDPEAIVTIDITCISE